MAVAFITHTHCRLHDMGPDHPEQPARLSVIEDELHVRGLHDLLLHRDAPRAGVEHLVRVHPLHYIESLADQSPSEGLVRVDPDTWMCPETFEAALRAAGANVLATDLVLTGVASRAFCNVRPPGHHAERSTAMGFCFFNNVAVAARHALDHHGLERVAVLDFDVHLGNGTEDILRDDERVLICSSYQHPLWPDLNPPTVPDRIINCPLPPGSGGDAFRQVVTERWVPALERFRPQLVLISAGFDAHAADGMARLRLGAADYGWVTNVACSIANRHAGGRIVSTLEGGYDLPALAASAATHVERLMLA
jgi:acetoin utilization deacetylase AcuC-like enzyme